MSNESFQVIHLRGTARHVSAGTIWHRPYPDAHQHVVLGSWANTLKLCPRFPFQLFYWDYSVGLVLGALLWGFTFGSTGTEGSSFLTDLQRVSLSSVLWAAAGGAVFNLANLLLVAAIDIAGMAVAFPIGIGLALVIGSVAGYLQSPVGNPYLVFSGVALVVAAIICDALAYKARAESASKVQTRGIVISLIAGTLMGTFTRSLQGLCQAATIDQGHTRLPFFLSAVRHFPTFP